MLTMSILLLSETAAVVTLLFVHLIAIFKATSKNCFVGGLRNFTRKISRKNVRNAKVLLFHDKIS